MSRTGGPAGPRVPLADLITLARLPLLPLVIFMLTRDNAAVRVSGAALLFLALMLDTVDGMVARSRGETSLFGSVLDIAADRTYELVLWIWFAALGLIPVLIPLIIAARTTLTDAFRSIGVGAGTAPFAQHRTGLGRFLVGSSWMRTGYAATKIVTFCGLALALAVAGPARTGPAVRALGAVAWVSVAFCLLRGLPVIVHALRERWRAEDATAQAA